MTSVIGNTRTISEAATAFMAIVKHFEYQQGPNPIGKSLTNFTFWTGAGFSKSWDTHAPLGSELFKLDTDDLRDVTDLIVLSRMLGLSSSEITLDGIRQIVYNLDVYDRYPDVCSRYIDPQNTRIIRDGVRAAILNRYEKLASINYFNDETSRFPLIEENEQQRSILRFFRYLYTCANGSEIISEGIRLHFATTNYDYVIETILDNILGPDDSLFLYTYRGFTPSKVAGSRNPVMTHQHWLTQHLIKLNGGFEILRESNRYHLDYSKRNLEQIAKQPPIIMLPSREQDYSDPYFHTIFPKIVRLMRETKILIIVGYSLPDDDALIRFVLKQFAEEPEDAHGKVIFYIDLMSDSDKRLRLKSVFPLIEQIDMPQVFTYQGSFSDFTEECVSLISNSI